MRKSCVFSDPDGTAGRIFSLLRWCFVWCVKVGGGIRIWFPLGHHRACVIVDEEEVEVCGAFHLFGFLSENPSQ